MIPLEDRLLFAAPKKGRLYETTVALLEKAGFSFRRDSRSDLALCERPNAAVVFLPAKDIPYFIGNGKVDLGVTGRDVIAEAGADVKENLLLGYGKCRLCLLRPNVVESERKSPRTVVTSFPRLTEKHFRQKGLPIPKVITLSGSVEIGCSLGLADAVTDLVQTGETIEKAGLEIVESIMDSQAVLISNPHTEKTEFVRRVVRRIQGVLTAENYAMIEYNIRKENLPQGEAITPGKRSPTVMPLENPEWVAVKALVFKAETHRLIEELEKVEARDILVHHVVNCGAL